MKNYIDLMIQKNNVFEEMCLSEEEYKERLSYFNTLVEQYFNGVSTLNKELYTNLITEIESGNKVSKDILVLSSAKFVGLLLADIFAKYKIKDICFEDVLGEVYLNIKERCENLNFKDMKYDYFTTFYLNKGVFSKFKSMLNELKKNNLDLAMQNFERVDSSEIPTTKEPLDLIISDENMNLIKKKFEHLKTVGISAIVCDRYGLIDGDDKSYYELAKKYNISVYGVKLRLAAGLRRIRSNNEIKELLK